MKKTLARLRERVASPEGETGEGVPCPLTQPSPPRDGGEGYFKRVAEKLFEGLVPCLAMR